MKKMIDVDKKKWTVFRKYCLDHDKTVKDEIDKFLNKYGGK